MQQRKDRRFKQWNKTMIKALADGHNSAGATEAEAFTYDLSLGGARIHSPEPFEVGTALRIRIELVRCRETVNLEGRVKWLKRNETESVFEMGIEFDHSNPQTFMSLMKNLHDGRLGPTREPKPGETRLNRPASS
jgi:Tfp pilus assembly protein PilZ